MSGKSCQTPGGDVLRNTWPVLAKHPDRPGRRRSLRRHGLGLQRAFWVGSWNTRDVPGKLVHANGVCTWADTVVPGAHFLILGTGQWFWERWALGEAWWRAMGPQYYVPLFISLTFKNKMLIQESTQQHGVVPGEPSKDRPMVLVSLSDWGRIPSCL